MMRQLQTFASSPTPEYPASERHFAQCLRILIATLPKKVTDDLGGELLVAAYRRMLGHFSDAAISHMTESALKLKWFPTIGECLSILENWQAPPNVDRQIAQEAVMRERELRHAECKEQDRAAMETALGGIATLDWLAINSMPINWKHIAYERKLGELDGWHNGDHAYKLAGTVGQWGEDGPPCRQ